MPNRRSTRAVGWILARTPRLFKTDPWQTMFIVAWLGMGMATAVAMFFPDVTSVVDQPLGHTLLRGLWSACFILGALFQLYALQHPQDGLLERLGISLAGIGAGVYGLALFAAEKPAGYALGVVFLILAAGHLIVLLAAEYSRRMATRAPKG